MKKKSANILFLTYSIILCGLGVLLSSSGPVRTNNKIVQYSIQSPEVVIAGEEFKILLLLDVQPNWYIYAPTGTNAAQGMIETKPIFILPRGIDRAGPTKFPESHFKDGFEVYEGKAITMEQTFVVSQSIKPGKYIVKGSLIWQSCNSEICLQPVTDDLTVTLVIK